MARVAKALRNVSARDLSRQTSKLLDEMELDGSALVVVRYGRPVAVVVPFEEALGRPHIPRVRDLTEKLEIWHREEDDAGAEELELDDDQLRVVRGIATCRSLHWTPGQSDLPGPRLIRALGSLELAGFVERGPGAARRLTRKGERVASGLDSEA